MKENHKIRAYKLDDFILQDRIGSGSFGKVYRVKEKKSRHIYAVKISTREIKDISDDLSTNISREVNIIFKLNHPAILKFVYFDPKNFKNKAKTIIIMEYASNGSLLDLLEHDRKMPHNKIITATRQLILLYGISKAMPYLHSHNILHRDLKPDNILLDEYLHPKVGDFGLSKTEDSMKTTIKTIKGTPKYILRLKSIRKI